jgi:uncharacterized membrane protein
VHNNYVTLPVVFTMLAGHFPVAFARDRAWLVLVAVAALLVLVRHVFNLWHTGRRAWWLAALAAAGAVALAVALRPADDAPAAAPAIGDDAAASILAERCSSCHSGASPPAGVRLESVADARAQAERVERMVASRAMPPGNVTEMTDEEREALLAWLDGG